MKASVLWGFAELKKAVLAVESRIGNAETGFFLTLSPAELIIVASNRDNLAA